VGGCGWYARGFVFSFIDLLYWFCYIFAVFNLFFMNKNQNESSVSNEYEERKKKLDMIREAGVQPYPERFERSHSLNEVVLEGENSEIRGLDEINNEPRRR